jgi:hypothetical protein
MSDKKPVRLFWYPAEEHGRITPPVGPNYFAVYRPKSQKAANEDWSVLLELSPPFGHKYCRGMLSFVSEQGPISSLRPGHTFYLFEGRWPVAEGEVLRDNGSEG